MNNTLASFPFRTMNRLNDMIEEMRIPEWNTTNWSLQAFSPSVDVSETNAEYKIKMDLPGFKDEDINVEVREDILTISGNREEAHDEKKDGQIIRRERSFGSFCRSFALDSNLATNKIDATFKDGVLTVTAAKAKQAPATKIPIGK